MLIEFTIPANTTEANPLRKNYEGFASIPRSITIHIPDGHKYLARLYIESRGLRLVPDLNAYIRGNNNNVSYPITRRIENNPIQLTCVGWNEDDTYPHTFYIEVI